MLIVNCPPSTSHLVIWRASSAGASPFEPRFLGTDEVNHIYTRLKMTIGGDILVVARRRDIVGEADTVIIVLEMHIDKTLIGTVKRDVPLGHCYHGVVVTQVWSQNHNTGVKEIRPANVGSCRKWLSYVEELVRSSVGNDIGIYVDDLPKLGLLPQLDLGKGRV